MSNYMVNYDYNRKKGLMLYKYSFNQYKIQLASVTS